jgi:fluoride exporter
MIIQLKTILAVSCGAALGALLRLALSSRFNAIGFFVPLGTLLSNLIGGYLVGVLLGFLSQAPALSPAWRLFLITGFCGGLTTFSTFSVEVVQMLEQGRTGIALTTISIHVLGSLLMTWAGLASASWWLASR